LSRLPDRNALKADLNKVQERNRLAFWVADATISVQSGRPRGSKRRGQAVPGPWTRLPSFPTVPPELER
jgi:hypothetical protein